MKKLTVYYKNGKFEHIKEIRHVSFIHYDKKRNECLHIEFNNGQSRNIIKKDCSSYRYSS